VRLEGEGEPEEEETGHGFEIIEAKK